MEWTNLVVPGIFVAACLFAFSQSRTEGWSLAHRIGTGIFLVGAAIGLFLDDLLAANSPILAWAELVAVGVMVVGGLVSWSGRRS